VEVLRLNIEYGGLHTVSDFLCSENYDVMIT